MSIVKKNLSIAFLARMVSSLSSFIMLPLYLPLMGQDAFGLIALGVATVQVLFMVSTSMRPVVTRDIAVRLTSGQPQYPVIRMNEGLSLIILCIIILICPWLAKIAIGKADLGELSYEAAVSCFTYLFLSIGFQSFTSSYVGVINGRQHGLIRALIINGKQICIAVGGYIALLVTDGNPLSYFQNLLVVEIVFAILSALLVWLPIKREFLQFRISRNTFSSIGKLGSINVLVGFVGALIAFIEKWLLGQYLSIASIGYFTLLMVPFIVIGNLSASVGNVVMPRLAELDAEGNETRKLKLLEKSMWVTNTLLICGICLISFKPNLLYSVWLRDVELVTKIIPFVSLAIIVRFPRSHCNLLFNYDLAASRLGIKLGVNLMKLISLVCLGALALGSFGLTGYLILLAILSVLEVFLSSICILNRSSSLREKFFQNLVWSITTIVSPIVLVTYIIPLFSKSLQKMINSEILEVALSLLATVIICLIYLLTNSKVREMIFEVYIMVFKKIKRAKV